MEEVVGLIESFQRNPVKTKANLRKVLAICK